jgi:hypothetical protein
MKTIEILITPAGQLTINVAGFAGLDCEKATAFLEQALGQVSQKQRKPEWYRPVTRRQNQKVGV